MTQALQNLLQKIIAGLYEVTDVTPTIDFTNDLKFGDYTTNIAMVLAKKVGKAPNIIALEIIEAVRAANDPALEHKISDITAIGGFVNFTLDPHFLWTTTLGIHHTYGENSIDNPRRIMIEYGQPNTHKLPHIGHLFSYIVGDSIAKIEAANGNSVMKVNYQGDIGPNVAKSIYGYIQIGQPQPADPLEQIKLLQKCYQEGSSAYNDDPLAKETIDDINKKIYTKDPEITKIWTMTRQWCVDYYQQFEKKLNIQQTMHYWESEVMESGKQIVEENIGKIFEKSDGAVVFAGEKYGSHTRVFLTKKNTTTYEAKEVGLNVQKYKDWPFDLDIITTASEQNAYFEVVMKAIELCAPHLEGKLKHIGFGMVSLSTGKMASRTGNILSGIDLIDEVEARVSEVMKSREEMNGTERLNTTAKVAMAAIKFTFLRQNILQNMKFDINESVSFEGRSGPYIQYTYARIQSVLRQEVDAPQATTADSELLIAEEEKSLMRWLFRYPQTVAQAGEQFAPHIIADYTYQLAQLFNTFYTKYPINKAKDENEKRARRTLAEKTAVVLKHGLDLLGIETVEKM